MRGIATIGVALLSGCVGPPSDPDKGPVVLKCNGKQTISEGKTEAAEKIDRIDGPAKKLEFWDPQESAFFAWGSAKPKLTTDTISYTGVKHFQELASTRTITFYRKSGKVSDMIMDQVIGMLSFGGDCHPVPDPSDAKRKF